MNKNDIACSLAGHYRNGTFGECCSATHPDSGLELTIQVKFCLYNSVNIFRFARNYRFLLIILFAGIIFSCGCVDSGNDIINNSDKQDVKPAINENTTFITIDPINPHRAGDSFTISGITNFGSDRQIWVEIAEDYFRATRIRNDGKFYGVAGNATIIEGTQGINRWEFHVNTSGWLPQQYYVYVFPASRDENYTKANSTLYLTS